MNLKLRAAMIMAMLALVASGMSVLANQGAEQSTADVLTLPNMDEVVGESTLVRNDNGIKMRLNVDANDLDGLNPGDVATIWWVIFNNPEECFEPNACGIPDVLAEPEHVQAAGISVFYAAGSIVGGSGKVNYAASLPEGRVTVDTSHEANQYVMGVDPILEDARGAEVHLLLRTHGPKIPEMVNQMLKTHDAGCTSAVDPAQPPPWDPPLEHLAGPNTCMNLAGAVHRP